MTGEFSDLFSAALRSGPAPHAVEIDTEAGRELLLCSSSGDGRLHDGGTLFVPADTPENRRRASITTHCPVCPDVNQGLMQQDFILGREEGTYAMAVYNDCDHSAAVRLDEDGPLYLRLGGQWVLFTPR